MPDSHPSTWPDFDLERLGSVSYLPPMEEIQHVRKLGLKFWAVFRSGDALVRSALPDDHPLLD